MVDGVTIPKVFDYEVTCEIDGDDFGPFDTWDPPETSGNTGRHRPGGSRTAVRTRGLRERGTGTLTIVPETAADLERFRTLDRKAGRAPMTVREQPLDPNGDPQGDASILNGLLDSVDVNNVDSDSNDDRQVTLTFAPDDERS